MFAGENTSQLEEGVDIYLPEDLFEDGNQSAKALELETKNPSKVEVPGVEPDGSKIEGNKDDEGDEPLDNSEKAVDDGGKSSGEGDKKETKSKSGAPEMIEYKEGAILKRLGQTFKELGIDIVSESDEKELNAQNFSEKLTESLISKQVSDPESELFKKVKDFIFDSNGIDDRVLSIAAGIPFGVNRDEYLELFDLKDVTSNAELFTMDNKESLQGLFETYHAINGQEGNSLNEYVQIDLENATPDLIEKRRKAISDYADKELNRINDEVKTRKDLVAKERAERTKLNNSFYEKGEVDGYSFTKEQFNEFFNAALQKTEEIELLDGSKRKVSALEKKRFEFEKENYEKALLQDMLFYFDLEDSSKKKKSDSKAKSEQGAFMKGLNDDMKKYSVADKSSNKEEVDNTNTIQIDESIFQ